MDRNQKKGIVSFISGIGVIFLLVGIFTDQYDFGTGLVVAILFWIMSGVISSFLGVDDDDNYLSSSYSHRNEYSLKHSVSSRPSFEKTATGAQFCARCGERVDSGSSFCSNCGASTS